MSLTDSSPEAPPLDRDALSASLGADVASLVLKIADFAEERGLALYLVGGVVRDLLLGRRGGDLDFALEAEAIAFAGELSARYGGRVQAYREFGVATWTLDADCAARFGLADAEYARHVDFVRARSERYPRPAALPTVTPGDITQDMLRRDFSVNALALRLSRAAASYKLVDPSGGLRDLEHRQIRVLHDGSFRDDPTRVFRALRLSERLGFAIAARTKALLLAASPQIDSLSGPRVRNEIALAFREPAPGKVLARFQASGALQAIRPGFRVGAASLQALDGLGVVEAVPGGGDIESLAWCLVLADAGVAIRERLALTRAQTRAVAATAHCLSHSGVLASPQTRPSQIAAALDGCPDVALRALKLLMTEPLAHDRVARYISSWRGLKPATRGDDLIALGLPPSPRFKRILDRLRDAWLDGEVKSAGEERRLLEQIASGGGGN